VIGGGITGITAAFLLKRAGKKVILIERAELGCGESGSTTAHLTQVLDTRYHRLVSKFGENGALLAARSSRDAIDRIARLVRDERIDCGFAHVPAFLYTESESRLRELKREMNAMRTAGLEARGAKQVPLPFPIQGAILVPHQARFRPLDYLLALAALIPGSDCAIHENTQALDIEEGERCRVIASSGEIESEAVIVATNSPVSNRFSLHTKIASYRTYAVAARIGSEFPDALFWDTADPYHYIRRQDDWLIVGGEDHKTGLRHRTEDCFARLETYCRDRFGITRFEYRWSGQIIEPQDGLPFIGRSSFSENIYVATGYSGNGMTFGTLAGMILSDLARGVENPYAELYSATRIKPLAGAKRFFSENVDYPLCFVQDRVRAPEVRDPSEIAPGEGKILRYQGRRLAAYRGPGGDLTALSPVCPHLGCHVHFNSSERSWDCPCHGSRFATDGSVLNGPATHGLEPIAIEAPSRKRRAA
jgi:glycine/D-amino acid oxidase-like deaminating enzyme/nitrite reductase/ring-hydroxylating ferredoxin subunit